MLLLPRKSHYGGLVPPSGTPASTLAHDFGVGVLWSFNGEQLPTDSITGSRMLTDPNAAGRTNIGAGGYGLGVSPSGNYHRIVSAYSFFGAETTYLFALSLINPSDATWRVLTTTKNNGGTSTSSFSNQYVIGVRASTGSITASNEAQALGPNPVTGLRQDRVNFVAVSSVRGVETRATINGVRRGTIQGQQNISAGGTSAIGYTRYAGSPLGSGIVSLHSVGMIRRAINDAEAEEITARYAELFEPRRIIVPMWSGATSLPTLTGITAGSITASGATLTITAS